MRANSAKQLSDNELLLLQKELFETFSRINSGDKNQRISEWIRFLEEKDIPVVTYENLRSRRHELNLGVEFFKTARNRHLGTWEGAWLTSTFEPDYLEDLPIPSVQQK